MCVLKMGLQSQLLLSLYLAERLPCLVNSHSGTWIMLHSVTLSETVAVAVRRTVA